jgi:hypothetical protein
MIRVERKLPRNNSIIRLVSAAAIPDYAADGGVDEDRLISDRGQHQIAGQGFFHLLHFFLDAVDDRQRGRSAVLEHEHQNRAVAVDMHDILLRRAAVAHMADVVNVDHGAVDRFDRQIAERLDRGRGVVEIDRVFVGADLLGADRRDQVLRGERVGDVLAGEPMRAHLLRVDINLNLTKLAAERVGHGRAGHGHDRHANEVQAEIEQRLLG